MTQYFDPAQIHTDRLVETSWDIGVKAIDWSNGRLVDYAILAMGPGSRLSQKMTEFDAREAHIDRLLAIAVGIRALNPHGLLQLSDVEARMRFFEPMTVDEIETRRLIVNYCGMDPSWLRGL